MAKKAKRASGFARGKVKTKRKDGAKWSGADARKQGAKPASPRSQTLPGMKRVRDQKLDNICEGIADERAKKNEADTEEKSLISSALKRMQARNVNLYKHSGVELARVPGSEKLRVRLTKDTGDAEVAGGETTTTNAGKNGQGEDGGSVPAGFAPDADGLVDGDDEGFDDGEAAEV